MARKGFFKSSQLQSKAISKKSNNVAHCKKCGLYKNCKSPYMKPGGRGEISILHVAEAGGKVEDGKNEQLVGQTGNFYKRILNKLGIDLNAGLKTNACICPVPSTKTPTDTQIKCCQPNLKKTINEFQPRVIIALGGTALKGLIAHKFEGDIGGINKWRGSIIPDREYNAWICPTFHPSFIQRDTTPEYAEKLFIQDLKDALAMLNVPVTQYQDEKQMVEIIKHHSEITHWMKELVLGEVSLTAFDYETSGLKPYREGQKIKTISISCGPNHVVAFPVVKSKNFRQIFGRYLASRNIKKIIANAPFEINWSNEFFNAPVNGFYYDTMVGNHVIDNRPGISSLDHQNYIRFGLEPYDFAVKKYLKPPNSKGNDFNYIDEVDLESLLIYNGMDSLTEFRQGLVQMDMLGIDYSHLHYMDSDITGRGLAPQYFNILKRRKTRKKVE